MQKKHASRLQGERTFFIQYTLKSKERKSEREGGVIVTVK